MPSVNRDIATILGRTEAANADNTALGTGSGGGTSITFIDSDGLLPDAELSGDSGDLVFSRSTNKIYVGEGSYWRSITTATINPIAELLVVAGGGGGSAGGGGGGGGLLYYGSETPKTPNGTAQEMYRGTAYTVTVGAGGLAKTAGSYWSLAGEQGDNSSIVGQGLNLVAIGGGGGSAGVASNTGWSGGDGGSGGGGGGNVATGGGAVLGGAGTAGQGNAGGAGARLANSPAGGGGGAGAAGANVASAPTAGGVGLAYDISGTTTYYAGGGGGGSYNVGGAAGGLGGGGNGANSVNQGAGAGTANTGGGAGGGGTNADAHGGSGIVIVRVPAAHAIATITGAGNTSTLDGDYRVYSFISDGTITF
jgi:hypothetical protein